MNRRWRNLASRVRQRRFDPPWVAPFVAPVTVPAFRARRRPPALFRRDGQFQVVPAQWPVPPSSPGRRSPRLVTARRGRFLALPPQPVAAAGPGPLAPSIRRSARRITLPTRRGEFTSPPWPQQAPPPPPAYPPDAVGGTGARRSPFVRRGRFLVFVPPPATAVVPVVPPSVTRRIGRPWPPVVPRGQFLGLATAPAAAPSPVRATGARRGLLARRGRFFVFLSPPPPPPGPAPLVPALHRRARMRLLPSRGGEFLRVTPQPGTRGQMTSVDRQAPGMASVTRVAPGMASATRTVASMRGV